MTTLLQQAVARQQANLDTFPFITELQLEKMHENGEVTSYHSGRAVQAGDQVLFGYLCDEEKQQADLIGFHADEATTVYTDYEGDLLPGVVEGDIPYIRLRTFEEYLTSQG